MGAGMGQSREGVPGWAARLEAEPPLSAEVENELARRAQAGDARARDRLVTAHLRHALRYARKLSRYGMSITELTNEGVVGILEAVDRYDPDRGVRFATYAASWIRALTLERLVRQMSPIGHAGGAYRTKYWFALRRERAKLFQRGVPAAEIAAHIAERLGIGVGTARELLDDLDSKASPLDAWMDETERGGSHEGRVTCPEREATRREAQALVRERLDAIIEQLDVRERAVIERRVLADDPDSLAVLGREHGISRERMRQLEHRTMDKLRRRFAPLRELL